MGQLNLDKPTATELLDAITYEGHLVTVAQSPRTPGEQYYAFNADESDDELSFSPRDSKSPGSSARSTKSSKLERMLGEDEANLKATESPKPQDEKQKGAKKKRGIGAFVRRLSTRAGFTSPTASQVSTPSDSVSTSPTSSSSNVTAAPLDGIQSSGSRTKLSKIFGVNVEEAKAVPEITVGLVPSRSETKLSKMLGADLGTLAEKRLSTESIEKVAMPQSAKKLQKTHLGMIPPTLDSPTNSLDSIEILPRGYLVATYKSSPTVAFVTPSTGSILFLKAEGVVLGCVFKHPYLFVHYDSYQILVYNVDVDRSVVLFAGFEDEDAHSQASSSLKASADGKMKPPVPPRPKSVAPLRLPVPKAFEKPTRGNAVFICDDLHFGLVGTYSGMYKVLLCPLASLTIDVFFQSHAVANDLHKAAHLTLCVPLEPMFNVSVFTMPVTPKSTTMHGLKLFLGCHDHWQLWDLKEGTMIMAAKPESLEDGSVATFNAFSWSGDDQICAASVDKAYAWSIKQKERLFTVRSTSFVSCISSDSRGILIGDKEGDITLRDFSEANKVVLSSAPRDKISGQGGEAVSSTDSFERKIDAIVRKAGEIIVSVSQSTGVAVWSALGNGSLLKQWTIQNGSVHGLLLDGNHARMILRHEQKFTDANGAAATKLSLEMWNVSLEFALEWVANQDDEASASEESDESSLPRLVPRQEGSKLERILGARRATLPDGPNFTVTGDDTKAEKEAEGRKAKKLMQVLGAGVLLKDENMADPASRSSGGPSNQHKRINALRLAESDKPAGGFVSRRKGSIHVKTTSSYQLNIPESLDGQFTLRNKTHMVGSSIFATTFRNSGNVLISSSGEETISVENPMSISAYCISGSVVFSLHRDGVLQALNVEKISVATSDINTHDGSPSPSPREREGFSMVLADPDGRRIAVVKTAENVYKVWEFLYTPSDGKSSPELELLRERFIDMTPPEETEDDTVGNNQSHSTGSLTPRRIAVIKPVDTLSKYWNGHVLLGSPTELQVFHLDTLSLVQRCIAASLDASSETQTLLFLSTQVHGTAVIASTRLGICLLSVAEAGPGLAFPAPLMLSTSSIVCDLAYPGPTSDAILAGTLDGFVAALRLGPSSPATTGGVGGNLTSVRDLVNQSETFVAACSLRAHPSAFVEKQHESDSARLAKRVNCISRKGKYIALGHEGDCVTVWAYDTGMSQPIFLREFPTKGPVVDVAVHTTSVTALVKNQLSQEMFVINLIPLNDAADEAIKQNVAAVAAQSSGTSPSPGAAAAVVAAAVTSAELSEMKELMKQMVIENRRLADMVAKSLEDRALMAEQMRLMQQQIAILIADRPQQGPQQPAQQGQESAPETPM
eukprot:TRINITY_DN709_c0_g1_i2.p1 TRINITY_DN709_c0_g1~~TRINITY_DN709_c0_g1_i2.p1  ORF type:complete len:1355 (+),score=283.11 TRINITY_DN709_c0_g1_i2:565-4629(+)